MARRLVVSLEDATERPAAPTSVMTSNTFRIVGRIVAFVLFPAALGCRDLTFYPCKNNPAVCEDAGADGDTAEASPSDAGTCADAGPPTESCGWCGMRSRGCVDGAYGPWGACLGEGECAPGVTDANGTACSATSEVRRR